MQLRIGASAFDVTTRPVCIAPVDAGAQDPLGTAKAFVDHGADAIVVQASPGQPEKLLGIVVAELSGALEVPVGAVPGNVASAVFTIVNHELVADGGHAQDVSLSILELSAGGGGMGMQVEAMMDGGRIFITTQIKETRRVGYTVSELLTRRSVAP